jgi:hypothetical protein
VVRSKHSYHKIELCCPQSHIVTKGFASPWCNLQVWSVMLPVSPTLYLSLPVQGCWAIILVTRSCAYFCYLSRESE